MSFVWKEMPGKLSMVSFKICLRCGELICRLIYACQMSVPTRRYTNSATMSYLLHVFIAWCHVSNEAQSVHAPPIDLVWDVLFNRLGIVALALKRKGKRSAFACDSIINESPHLCR